MKKWFFSIIVLSFLLVSTGCAEDLNRAMFEEATEGNGTQIQYQGDNYVVSFRYPRNFKIESVKAHDGALETIQYKLGLIPAFYINVYGKEASVKFPDITTEHYQFVVEGAGEPEELLLKIKTTLIASEYGEVSDKSME